jgi:uncharacterized protein (TIGR00290 family)
MKQRAFFNWSGGKDSAFALFHVLKEKKLTIDFLLTTLNSDYRRISMHGVREELLDAQAKSIGIELKKLYLPENVSMADYDKIFSESIKTFKNGGIENAIFGDIFLQDLRDYREKRLAEAGVKCHFPLWEKNTRTLVKNFIDLGFKTIITCVDERYLDKSFSGRIIDHQFIADLPENVDPCGENGEFHSFVFDGPMFKEPVAFNKGNIVYRIYKSEKTNNTGFWFCDLLPVKNNNSL